MRFGQVLMAYFVVGVMMWAAVPSVGWGLVGVGDEILNEPQDGTVETEQVVQNDLEGIGGAISSAVQTVSGGGILAVWNILTGFVSLIFWPVTVLVTVDAPATITVLLGGGMSMAFLVGLVRTVRSSA